MNPSEELNANATELDSLSLPMTATDPLIGTIIGQHFKITSRLGSGGMSTVYRANHLLMNQRDVAIKVMHPGLVDQTSMKRFQQEASATAKFSHPNAITLIDFGISQGGLPYIILELCEGQSLSSWIEGDRQKNWRTSVEIMLPICAALAEAHKNGVVHRDLKPSNIMVLQDGDKLFVKVLDFGIARMIGKDDGGLAGLTQTGEVLGSPQYMSPEQCRGLKVDDRSDIYSLGCLMYELLTGVPAVVGENPFSVMHSHLSVMPPSFSAVTASSAIPPRLEEIVFKCLAKRPEQRYQSIVELELALQDVGTSNEARLGFFEQARRHLRDLNRNKTRAIYAATISAIVCASGAACYYLGMPWFFEQKWKTEFAAGKAAAQQGDLTAATNHFVSSVQAAAHTNSVQQHQLDSLNELTFIYAQRGQYKNMDLCRNQVSEIKNSLNKFNTAVFSRKDLEELAAARLQQAPKKVIKGKYSKTYLTWIEQLDDTAKLCANGGMVKEARQLTALSDKLHAQLTDESEANITRNTNLGVTYAMHQQFDLAEKYMTEAYNIAKRAKVPSPKNLVVTQTNMGRLYTVNNNFAAAEKILQSAVELGLRTGSSVKQETIDALKDLAALRRAQGRIDEARNLEQDATKLARDDNKHKDTQE